MESIVSHVTCYGPEKSLRSLKMLPDLQNAIRDFDGKAHHMSCSIKPFSIKVSNFQ